MDYIQCEDQGNVQSRFFYGELLQRIRLRRASNVLEGANFSLGNLLPVIRMGRTRSGGAIGKMHKLTNFFLQRHLAEQFGNALLDPRIIQRRCSGRSLRSK